MSAWIIGTIAVLVGLLGGVLAANAIDLGIYLFGFGLILFAVWFVFWLIKDNFDQQQKLRTERGSR